MRCDDVRVVWVGGWYVRFIYTLHDDERETKKVICTNAERRVRVRLWSGRWLVLCFWGLRPHFSGWGGRENAPLKIVCRRRRRPPLVFVCLSSCDSSRCGPLLVSTNPRGLPFLLPFYLGLAPAPPPWSWGVGDGRGPLFVLQSTRTNMKYWFCPCRKPPRGASIRPPYAGPDSVQMSYNTRRIPPPRSLSLSLPRFVDQTALPSPRAYRVSSTQARRRIGQYV